MTARPTRLLRSTTATGRALQEGDRHQSGQALTESGLLLATLVGGLAVGGVWLMKTHPEMLNAINTHVRGFYYLISLPFP